jgi:hypothetical protein
MRPVWRFLARLHGNGLFYGDLEPHCALTAEQLRRTVGALIRSGSGEDVPEALHRALDRALGERGPHYADWAA